MMKKYIITFCLLVVGVYGFAQTRITGTVLSKVDNSPLVGVMIIMENSQKGTITDVQGKYFLENVPADASLQFSMLGFKSQSVVVNNKTLINILLDEQVTSLDDVIVVGYGTVKKSDLTSSISTIKGDDITQVSTGNAMSAIQGKVNGVQVTSGGGPGATPRIIIRGVTTVNGSDPLYVVNGMPVGTNINFLNSDDIESMEILKDASASAVYGTRGSNGVILVTTKQGKVGDAKFTFSTNVGIQSITDPNMAGASEYEQVVRRRYENDSRAVIWNGKTNVTDAEGTDWWGEAVNSVALTQNYNFGFMGGTEKLTYSFNLGYYRNESQFDVGYWDKITARLSTDYKFNDVFKVGIDMSPYVETWDDTPGVFGNIMGMDPTTSVMRPEDEWSDNPYNNYSRSKNNEVWNPVAEIGRMDKSSRNYGFITTPYISAEPIKGLVIRSQFGVNARFRRSDSFTPSFYIDTQEKNETNAVGRKMDEWLDWNWTNTVNYMKEFKKHRINVMAGYTMEQFANYSLAGSSESIPNNSDELQEIDAGTKNQKSGGNSTYTSLISYLGRVMYNYDSRYYATITARTDGSSKFPETSRYATFPSVSVAWRLTGEEFMKNLEFINEMKFRAGWGRVGNQNIDNSAYLTLLGQSDYVFGSTPSRLPGSAVSSVGNNGLVWETVEDFNIGIDVSLLNSRLNLTADYFQKTSTDMLYKKQNIYATGYPDWNCTVWSNVGSMKAEGWELAIQWRDRTEDFSYDIGLNLSSVKNTAIKFSGDGAVETGGFNQDFIIKNVDGGEISRFYGYLADGIFQNWSDVYAHTDENGKILQPNAVPGDIRFANLNNDDKIDQDDKTFIGKAFPDLMVGLNISLAYKNFDFATNFYGTFGNDAFNTNKSLNSGSAGNNVYEGALGKSWNGDGSTNEMPRLSVNDLNKNYTTVSSFFVEDASYFRCQLIQLGYTIPKSKTSGLDIRLHVSAQNLFTITNYSGLDPERASMGGVLESGIDWAAYPNPRTFLFGVNLKF